jgi:hypothetical protein
VIYSSEVLGFVHTALHYNQEQFRGVENVADMGLITNAYKTLARIPEGRDISRKMGTLVVRWILKKQYGSVWIGFVCHRSQWQAFVNMVMNFWVL